jgi:23S rRNA-/tRNA-specific pseudouridylate synthase
MHQIRVHLAEDGYAMFGDSMYAPSAIASAASRVMLHAKSLEIEHPISGARLVIEAPLPDDFSTLIKKLGFKNIV